jgi:alginate O-acetyltransferase complex protein AlgI
MLFNSLEFMFVFLPVVWLLSYTAVRFGATAAVTLLGAASLLFYAWWDYRYVALLLLSIAFNFGCGVVLARGRIGSMAIVKKHALVFAIGVNLAVLGYYKYANFFLDSLHSATGMSVPLIEVVLPLGISFFTFTQLAFLVDVYRGFAAEYRFSRYLLFVTYFPHLIAGPILHHKEMMPQFDALERQSFRSELIAMGLSIFAMGLAKKVLLADQLATIASPVFALAREGPVSFFEAWFGALAYTLQLYFDFSGYCDMAIGISLMFGIKLPINFNSPYKARNIIDFWRRWHMTLSRFLRDYLYIPLGGNRHGPGHRYVNLFATMLLGGLWHGAAWTYVVWGGLHGAFLAINHAWQSRPLARRLRQHAAWTVFSVALTLFCVVVAWVFFRAESFDTAWRMLGAMFGGGRGLVVPDAARYVVPGFGAAVERLHDWGLPLSWGPVLGVQQAVILIPPLLLFVLFAPNTQELFGPARVAVTYGGVEERRSAVVRWRPSYRWALGCVALAVAAMTALHRASEFLYYQF